MRDDRYVFYESDGTAVHIEVRPALNYYPVYVDGKHHACADTRAEADEIVRDYAIEHKLTETKPKSAKKKTSRSSCKRSRKVL